MIDDSQSMEESQRKLRDRLPEFMQVLEDLPDGLPDLHVAVVSSSLGAGIFPNVSTCHPGSPGDDDGRFQHPVNCTALNSGETYIKAAPGGRNFQGDISAVFRCIASLGVGGCGFEQPLLSVQRALEKASDPNDSDNGGFLRADAYLAVVLLTNEDDCSIPFTSELIDPRQTMIKDTLGGLQSYRCNEFGHLCDGQPPPHNVSMPTPLQNCVPADENGALVPVSQFVQFLKSLKDNDPNRVLVAALAGPPTPYVVEQRMFPGVSEPQPAVRHSCTGNGNTGAGGSTDAAMPPADFADPAVRIAKWVGAFGINGVFASICDEDFGISMRKIADTIGQRLRPACLDVDIKTKADGQTPDCQISEVVNDVKPGTSVPFCAGTRAVLPCWELIDDSRCIAGKVLRICRDAACDQTKIPDDSRYADVQCAIGP